MKKQHNLLVLFLFFVGASCLATSRERAGTNEPLEKSIAGLPGLATSPLGADYQGDCLTVTPSECSARLRCPFQRLEGEATREGLWLRSTVTDTLTDRFRVVARSVGRVPVRAPSGEAGPAYPPTVLPATGDVSVDGSVARFTRPGLMEEYSVSMDGLRQDFVVLERPEGTGELRVQLEVTGVPQCGIESAAYGAHLVLPKSGRRISYSRLRVTDATGKELPARIQVATAP